RRAVRGWGLEVLCLDPTQYSSSLTAVLMPDGHDADALRSAILERFDMSLGTGLGKLQGKVFRIGHLGDFNDLALAGTLSGVQMGLAIQGLSPGNGVGSALEYLASSNT
ncbi:MAG: serine--glyoxylate aminotransferase, partial [Chromatiales bacterium]|nr:serine--glyoxylate aminotransferase [Chromatiales bacterium]